MTEVENCLLDTLVQPLFRDLQSRQAVLGFLDQLEQRIEVFSDDRVFVEPELPEALDRAMGLAEEAGAYGGAGVLVTGSVVLVGDTRRLLGATGPTGSTGPTSGEG